ncbi:MAG: ABC transporter ATP-binding protein [Pseudomonadota bacterium]|nr:ABC transporter ATP-binding protein [Pseudomonadota bacterium]
MIRLEGVSWAPEGHPVLDRLDLSLEMGRVTAIVGPSGCGKSSLLRVLAGLRAPDAGRVTGVPKRKAFVFQDAALLPWLTLRDNVALPGRFGPIGNVDEALARVGLVEHAAKLPAALSGGQRMRGSLARALVAKPELVLLDEAFAALDGLTRASVQREFLALQAEHAWTVVMVTHELVDAVRLSDRVVAVSGPPLVVRADLAVPYPRPRDPSDLPPIVAQLEAVYAA